MYIRIYKDYFRIPFGSDFICNKILKVRNSCVREAFWYTIVISQQMSANSCYMIFLLHKTRKFYSDNKRIKILYSIFRINDGLLSNILLYCPWYLI